MMHGKSFDLLARQLAGDGCIVVAADLRGFGQTYQKERDSKTDYQESLEDLIALIRFLKHEYPGLPLYCAGESLGAHLARRLGSAHPDLISGLILSSPCIRPRMVSVPLIPHISSEIVRTSLNPQRQVDLSPFAQQFLKVEEHNLKYYLEDPMTRKSLNVLELIDSLLIAGSIDSCILPEEMPVFVLRGKNDCVCELSSSKRFVETLNTKNLMIYTCPSSGHLILQSRQIQNEVLAAIKQWLHRTTRQS
jgi:alpha-beta hydrolase superfamily lysophospholipase